MAISSPGLGSNLDVNTIVSQLMALEQRPLTALAKKEAGFQAKISALGSLQSAVAALQTAAGNLVPATGSTALQKFSLLRTALSDTTIAAASASSSAVAGTYRIEVTRLASQHVIASATGAASPFSGAGTTLPTGGTLTISLDSAGGSSPHKSTAITIADGATPENVRDAINSASAGVAAVVINGTAGKQLVLTSDAAGSNQIITLAGVAGLAYDPNATPVPATDPFAQTQAAQGSAFKLNGIAVEASSNTVTTALDGVTLNLLKGPELPATSVSTTLTISRDTTSISSGVNALVKAFNEFHTTASSLGSYDAASKRAGALNGDSTLRTAQESVRAALGKVPSELASASLQRLTDIGVTLQKDGKLSIDSTKLGKAIGDDLAGVANLVSAYGKAFRTATEGLTGSGGLIAARSEGLSASIKGLGQQSEIISARLTQIEARYRKQFTALDTLMAGMTKTSSFLQQQLANLPTYNQGS
ncbi:flagellar filament capping protein FliD [Accumulibacter sp.]|uniref:flagellar filament capping protein FliD n=1 Tax=Accumulibacter sp. TaxID=2053492 RepID=UPI0025D6EA9A|nr:flagellar filament capping protein FliD [Accumulibacter sp.]MCM8612558.1 flagellar filament capping protein FliD [Accumulibacter sp.]MCM8636180.1 flagellar filament capping protein FliD [Accumulibacter sp.]MCM8639876.1 flagellar filament capping protein FliD [Accumulibacter sp.]